MSSAFSAARPVLGGTVVVCCIHDRPKREVRTLAFDVRKTSIHLCTCCENVFLDPSDHEVFCPECRGSPVHAPAAPLPSPGGRI